MAATVPPNSGPSSVIRRFVARHLNSPGELGELARQLRAAATQGSTALAVKHAQLWASPTYQQAYREEVQRGAGQVTESEGAHVDSETPAPIPSAEVLGDAVRSSPEEPQTDQRAVAEAINRYNRMLRDAATPVRSAAYVRDLPEPKWEFWKLMGSVEVWQAVALMVRLDPDSLLPRLRGQYEGADSDFYSLLRIIRSRLGDIPAESLHLSDPDKTAVKLAVICTWMAKNGLKVPPELADLVPLAETKTVKASDASDSRSSQGFVAETTEERPPRSESELSENSRDSVWRFVDALEKASSQIGTRPHETPQDAERIVKANIKKDIPEIADRIDGMDFGEVLAAAQRRGRPRAKKQDAVKWTAYSRVIATLGLGGFKPESLRVNYARWRRTRSSEFRSKQRNP